MNIGAKIIFAYALITAYALVLIQSQALFIGIAIMVLVQNRIMVKIVKWSEEDADKFSIVLIITIASIYAFVQLVLLTESIIYN